MPARLTLVERGAAANPPAVGRARWTGLDPLRRSDYAAQGSAAVVALDALRRGLR
jgi:hypothetical protein